MASLRRPYIGLFLLVVLAAGLRLFGVERQSLSNDEVLDLAYAKLPVAEIVFAADGFPPLYALAVHAWLAVSPDEASVRLLSVLLGTLAVPLISFLAWRTAGPGAALGTAALLALSPYHIWFSQEARAYSLYFLLAVLSLWLFRRARDTGRAVDWFGFALSAALGLYSHYYFALLVAATGVLALLTVRPGGRLRTALLSYVAIGLASLPFVWLLPSDLAEQAGYTSQTPFDLLAIAYTFYAFVAGFSLGPSTRELHALPVAESIRMLLPWVAVLGAASACFAWCALERTPTLRRTNFVELLGLAVVPVLVGGVAAEIFHVGFKPQYVMWCAVPLFVVLGTGLSTATCTPLGRTVVAVFVLVQGLAVVNRYASTRYATEDTRGVAAFLFDHTTPSGRPDPVLVSAGYMSESLGHYARRRADPGFEIHPLPPAGGGPERVGAALAHLDRHVPAGAPYWLVYTRPFHGDSDGALLAALQRRDALSERAAYAGAIVYRGRPAADRHGPRPEPEPR